MAQEGIQEQIKLLEAQLEAKKRELESIGEHKENHEVIREVIKDIAQNPIVPLVSPAQTAITDDQKKLVELKEKEHEHIVRELLNLAISKDPFSAIKIARALKNPHIEDEFHDKLATYFDKLIESRKIIT
ncbi:MAG: hypothetical protein AAB795_01245 [Patescibacteria group bacterium]